MPPYLCPVSLGGFALPAGWTAVNECKTDDDTQIEQMETEAQARNVGNEFQLKKFLKINLTRLMV